MQHIDSLPHARPNLLSYNVVCARLGVSRQTFHNLADSGQLGPVYRVGILKKVTEHGVDEYLRRICDIETPLPTTQRQNSRKKKSKRNRDKMATG